MFQMPAEWAPQKRIWLSWPHAKADWPGKFAPIPFVFAEMIRVAKDHGFSDAQLAELRGRTEVDVRTLRHGLGLRPVFKTAKLSDFQARAGLIIRVVVI